MKRFFIFFLILSILLSSIVTFADDNSTYEDDTTKTIDDSSETTLDSPEITATSAIVIDAQNGQILYEKNANDKKYPASITKIMTSLLALENGNWSDSVTFSENAIWGIERDSTHIALDVGEVIPFKDCMHAILIVSANEAALGMAEHIGGTDLNFYKMMNDRAKELGCLNTNFTNPNGLHDDNHYTTAYDMSLITKKALEFTQFREITSTKHYIIEPTNKQTEQRELWADNRLILEDSEYYYEFCEGGKTGYTDEAQGTLVSWAKKGDMELITVIMETSAANTYIDSKALYDYCFDNYVKGNPITSYSFSEQDYITAKNILDGALDNVVPLRNINLSVDFTVPVLYKKDINIANLVPTISFLSAPNDNLIGTISYSDNDNIIFSYNISYSITKEAIATTNQSKTHKKSALLSAIKFIFIILFIIALILGGLFIYIKILEKKRRQKRLRGKR